MKRGSNVNRFKCLEDFEVDLAEPTVYNIQYDVPKGLVAIADHEDPNMC